MHKFLLAALVGLSLFSCGSGAGRGASAGDGYDTLYTNRYAAKFCILGRGDTVVLRVTDPWQGAKGYSVDYAITKPAGRIICMSSSHVAFLDELGLADSIVGVSGLPFITNPTVHRNNVRDVGSDRYINYELTVALRPDAMFVYEVSGENSSVTEKLMQLGLPVVYIADYLESSPLGKAEWIMAFGALTGRMRQAERVFADIEQRYLEVKNSAVSRHDGPRPKVMLNSPYRDIWYVPGDRSYMVRLIDDAGGDYLASGVDDDASRPISIETAYKLMLEADIWLSPSVEITDLASLRSGVPRFASMNVMKKGNVYNSDARGTPAGGSDFWESGAVRPDIVLKDLAKIFYPDALPGYELYFFRRLE